ncbi:MAG TPA: Ig-like domain repeat protein [Verrucomicrobiae bacterium]|nr:Ig-like domain repeat protein [Verrucomicrobiae bacterium]
MKFCWSLFSAKSLRPISAFGLLLLMVSVVLPVSAQVRETPPQVLNGSAILVQHYAGSMLRLTIGLQPPHMDQEEEFLRQLQTKGSPEFHHFLTAQEWSERFDPSQEDEQAVVDWAKGQGLTITQRYPNRLLVDVEGPVATIEKAFGLTINQYQLAGKSFFSSDRDPQIPSSLTSVIQSVGGLNNLQVMKPASRTMKEPAFADYTAGAALSTGTAGAQNGDKTKLAAAMKASEAKLKANITGGAYDPTDMFSSQAYDTNALYNEGHCCNPLGNSGVTPPQTSIAIATAGSQQVSDMAGFQSRYTYLAYHFQEYYIDGTPSCCDGEGTMDLEWSTSMSNSFGSYVDTAMVYMYDGVNAQFSTFNDIYNHMLSDGYARNFSTSWGCEELACYDSSDMNTAHGIFNSMVGQGWTLAAATGDQGASAGCGDATAIQYPASDPDVVASGGITLSLSSGPVFNYEVAWSGGPYGCGSNDGGSTGGYSSYFATPGYQSSLGLPSRGVPDIALNADWYYTPQNLYFEGGFQGNGGTSIVAPEMAGFFANEEAYLLYLSSVISGGLCNGHSCGPMGNGNNYLYWFGEHSGYAPHYPFYDITSGCNNNDVTSYYNLTYYCASTGWDPVTGWGSFNMFQMARAINTYEAGDFAAPTVTFYGPTTGKWYNSDQEVSWTVTDNGTSGLPAVGVGGFSQGWDADPGDPFSEGTPGAGNSFYSGPQYFNATSGCLDFTGTYCAGTSGQGWHYVYVRPWDNSGFSSVYYYGPIGYDSVAPSTTDTLSGTFNGTAYTTAVKVTLSATDASSGVAHTYYQLGSNPVQTYSGPFTISSTGGHTLYFYSVDVAGNVEGTHTVSIPIEAPTTTKLVTGANPSVYYQTVTFTATVTGSFGATPTGYVTFKSDGVSMGPSAPLNSSGVATLTFYKFVAGTHTITATYGGSGKNVSSTSSPLTQTVNKASTTTKVTSSLNPSKSGQSVTFTATVAGEFGGNTPNTMKFKDGSTFIATVTTNATTHTATFTTSTLSVGTHNIQAVYEGGSNLHGSTSSVLKQVVNQ